MSSDRNRARDMQPDNPGAGEQLNKPPQETREAAQREMDEMRKQYRTALKQGQPTEWMKEEAKRRREETERIGGPGAWERLKRERLAYREHYAKRWKELEEKEEAEKEAERGQREGEERGREQHGREQHGREQHGRDRREQVVAEGTGATPASMAVMGTAASAPVAAMGAASPVHPAHGEVDENGAPGQSMDPDEMDVDTATSDVQDVGPTTYRVPDMPDWYAELKRADAMKRARHNKALSKNTNRRAIVTALDSLKECMKRCEKEQNRSMLGKLLNELRDHVHKAEFLAVDEWIVVKTHILDNENGLPKIFAPESDFPWDLKADAFQLYNRWAAKEFEVALLRGIVKSKTKGDNRTGDRLDPAYRRLRANYYGQGDLVLGQWWPTQLSTVRDGAHGSAQAGIYGEKEKGAFSIIVAGGSGYDDKDMGDEIYYSGTISKDDTATDATIRMLESYKLRNPVRVLRSSNLALSNPYRPERGYRYDGLYRVIGYQLVKQEGAVHRFQLVRLPGQNPIRSEKGQPSSRPTQWEIQAHDKEVAERAFKLASGQN